eukprot:Partr_v1_DN28689_c4_g1_i2_m50510 putative vacuolar protein sorting 51 homolog (S. cerevisiae)
MEIPKRPGRSRLTDFYGIQSTANPTQKSRTLDLDDVSFSPDLYLDNMLMNKPIVDIAKSHVTLASEVKSLDGDMKTLVYENYGKFISATDTIHKIKTNMDNMEAEMEKLDRKMLNICKNSGKVSKTFSEKSVKMRELSNRLLLLQKVNFIFELPTRLKNCLTRAQFTEAALFYDNTADTLQRYRDLKIFSKLESDSLDVLREISKRLKVRAGNPRTSMSELRECFSNLLALREDPFELGKEYIRLAAARLNALSINSDGNESLTAAAVPISPISENDVNYNQKQITHLRSLDRCYLSELSFFMSDFLEMFLKPEELPPNVPVKIYRSKRMFSVVMDPTRTTAIKSEVEGSLSILADQYFGKLSDILGAEPRSHETTIALLDELHQDVLSLSGNSVLFDSLIHQRVVGLISSTLVHNLKEVFLKLRIGLIRYIKSDELTPMQTIDRFHDWFKSPIKSVCAELSIFYRKKSKFVDEYLDIFCDNLLKQSVEFWRSVFIDMSEYCENDIFKLEKAPATSSTAGQRAILILCFARLCNLFKASTIDYSFVALMDRENWLDLSEEPSGSSVLSLHHVTPDHNFSHHPYLHESSPLKEHAEKLASYFRQRFVLVVANQMTIMIKKSFDTRNWLRMKEPKRVSRLLEQLFEDLGSLDCEVAELCHNIEQPSHQAESSEKTMRSSLTSLRQQSEASRRGASTLSVKINPSFSTNQMVGDRFGKTSPTRMAIGNFGRREDYSNIDKLFSERIEVYAKVIPKTRAEVFMVLVKVILKAFGELARQRVFCTEGLQQIQVDCECLRTELWKYASDEKVMMSMIDDILQNASRRCIDPVFMEQPVVAMILDKSSTAGIDL